MRIIIDSITQMNYNIIYYIHKFTNYKEYLFHSFIIISYLNLYVVPFWLENDFIYLCVNKISIEL